MQARSAPRWPPRVSRGCARRAASSWRATDSVRRARRRRRARAGCARWTQRAGRPWDGRRSARVRRCRRPPRHPSLLLPLPVSLLYTPSLPTVAPTRVPTVHSLPPYCCPYPCPYCTLPSQGERFGPPAPRAESVSEAGVRRQAGPPRAGAAGAARSRAVLYAQNRRGVAQPPYQSVKRLKRPRPRATGHAARGRGGARRRRTALRGHRARARAPPPPRRTKWTRRVPHLVLSGHAASLTPY